MSLVNTIALPESTTTYSISANSTDLWLTSNLSTSGEGRLYRMSYSDLTTTAVYVSTNSVFHACVSNNDDVLNNTDWKTLLPQQKLSADNIHEFTKELCSLGGITHIRLNIFPDGGVSRLRIYGKISK